MSLLYDHGAVQWLAADAATTTYVVSSMSFQPKALRFWWVGLQSASDAASEAVSERRGMGFATSTSDRRCAESFSSDAAVTSDCSTGAFNNSIAATSDGAGAVNGLLDITALAADGFTLTVDDQGVADITIFWEAWGGTDITVAACFDIATPAAGGNQTYTVTGFTSGATDQVVFLAGVLSANALNTPLGEASAFCIGAAAGTAAGDNICVGGSADDASTAMDTDGWALDGQIIGMIVAAGDVQLNIRGTLTAWTTNGFTINYAESAVANRRFVGLAMKGGSWKSGSYTIEGQTTNATATISGLATAPKGVNLMGRMTAEQAADVADVNDRIGIGCGTSTSSRRSMGILDEDATASSVCEINTTIQYDQVLCFPSTAGGLQAAYDINAVNSDGFEFIVDTNGGVTSEWIGYVMFGDTPGAVAPIQQMMHHYKTMAAA